jgi:hypothetical protein
MFFHLFESCKLPEQELNCFDKQLTLETYFKLSRLQVINKVIKW